MLIEGAIGLCKHKALELHGVMRSCSSVNLEHPCIEDGQIGNRSERDK